MKHFLLLITLISVMTSCGRKNEITPLFENKKLVQQYGDGEHFEFNIRMPLTESSIDTYEDVTRVNSRVLGGLMSSFKSMFYNMGASMGMGKTLIHVHQVLPEIDPEYIKEIKISKVFFTIDDTVCNDPDIDFDQHPICSKIDKTGFFKNVLNLKKKKKSTFDFVKNAVIKVTPSDEVPPEDTVVTFPKFKYSSFNDMLKNAFPGIFDPEVKDSNKKDKEEKKKKKAEDQEAAEMRCDELVAQGILSECKVKKGLLSCLAGLKKYEQVGKYKICGKRKEVKDAQDNYTQVNNLNDNYDDVGLINRERYKEVEIGKYYRGKKGIIIGRENDSMMVFKTNYSYLLKKYIESHENFKKKVKEMVAIQGAVFLELKDKKSNIRDFTEEILKDIDVNMPHVKVDDIKSCLESDCISLRINEVNLVNLLKNRKSVKIKTFLDVKDVPSEAFQLKGYVEFKIKVKADI